MLEETGLRHDDKGLTARHLVLIFLACVAVCAVFFSAGFLVGYNERLSKVQPLTEHVSSPSAIPPVVNPPAAGSSSDAALSSGRGLPEIRRDTGAQTSSPVSDEPLSGSDGETSSAGLQPSTGRQAATQSAPRSAKLATR